jgi:protoporphyrinogen oxidase
MVPDVNTTTVGMEYFCDEDDQTWKTPDEQLIDLALRELAQLQLARRKEFSDGLVVRQPKAYPVYDKNYSENLKRIRSFLSSIENLQTIGRNGMHRYNNMDHAMLTGLLAARNIPVYKYNLWEVNEANDYLEVKALS